MRTRDILSKHHQQNELASHDIIVRLTLRVIVISYVKRILAGAQLAQY